MMLVKAAIPLVNVVVWINRADAPQVGYIYETMDQVKETISEAFESKPSMYTPIWNVIDEVWDAHLHSPLHIGGYHLNPSLFYSEFYWDAEVETGWSNCIHRMQDQQTWDKVSLQMDKCVLAQDDFSKGRKTEGINKYHPGKKIIVGTFFIACILMILRQVRSLYNKFLTMFLAAEWWSPYANQFPELQKYAIRILSQTCGGASKYGLKRSLSKKLLTDGMNHIEQQRLSDLAFVHYNLQLQNFHLGGGGDIVADEINPTDDWIADDEDLEWM